MEINKLDKAKEIIAQYFDSGDCGIFDTYGTDIEPSSLLYEGDGLEILLNFYWAYFDVIGLSDEEFAELEEWYENKRRISSK